MGIHMQIKTWHQKIDYFLFCYLQQQQKQKELTTSKFQEEESYFNKIKKIIMILTISPKKIPPP